MGKKSLYANFYFFSLNKIKCYDMKHCFKIFMKEYVLNFSLVYLLVKEVFYNKGNGCIYKVLFLRSCSIQEHWPVIFVCFIKTKHFINVIIWTTNGYLAYSMYYLNRTCGKVVKFWCINHIKLWASGLPNTCFDCINKIVFMLT